jgi:hypothetical protein
MGTTDKTTHHFTCPKCKATETVTILEKGSNWGASWENPPVAEHFVVEWIPNQFGEPRPATIKCKSCGSDGIRSSI